MSELGSPNMTQFTGTERDNGKLVSFGSDKSLHVRFYNERVFMEFKSQQAGRPIYEDMEFVHIVNPGAKTDIKRKVRLETPMGSDIPSDPERFPRQWNAFKNQQEQAQSGTPLEEFGFMPANQREDFKACRIHTVEQLAAMHDGNANGMPLEWRKWRDKAQAWLQKAQDNAPIAALQSENESLKTDLDALKQQMALLMQNQSQEPAKRGPGRPPKTEE